MAEHDKPLVWDHPIHKHICDVRQTSPDLADWLEREAEAMLAALRAQDERVANLADECERAVEQRDAARTEYRHVSVVERLEGLLQDLVDSLEDTLDTRRCAVKHLRRLNAARAALLRKRDK